MTCPFSVLFELLWKSLWLGCYGIPLHLSDKLDAYGQGLFGACLFGVVLTPLVLPWGYLYRRFVRASGDRWK